LPKEKFSLFRFSLFTLFCTFVPVKAFVFEHSATLPALKDGSFFHSPDLMELYEHTPRHKPYMVVLMDDNGHEEAHLLAVTRYKRSLFPPYLYIHVRVIGQGVYQQEPNEQKFGCMVKALKERLQNKVLYIEFSDLPQKMFGYEALRSAGFLPVRWMSVHNSLHSRTPEERISPKQLTRIKNAQQRGATTKIVETEEEFKDFSKLMRRHNWLKPRKYIPDSTFFRGLMDMGKCKLFITQYHGKTIGCSVCVYSDNDAYLWFSAARRKSYPTLHPNVVTFWETIKEAHRMDCQHIRFLDVGLPFRKNPYRDFILRFGGKEVSTYRWFRISIRWVNSIASWLWRE
jgi:hypothetical protein